MPDLSDFATALEAVLNRRTAAADLAVIAAQHPQLRSLVAKHPHAYPELLDWLDGLGDPQLTRDVAERRAADATLAPLPGIPVSPHPADMPQLLTNATGRPLSHRFARAWITALAVIIVVGIVSGGAYALSQHTTSTTSAVMNSSSASPSVPVQTSVPPVTPPPVATNPWTQVLGGTTLDRFLATAVLPDGDIVAAGLFESTDGTLTQHVAQSPGSGVALFAPDGTLQWMTTVGDDNPASGLNAVAITPDGHIVAVGSRQLVALNDAGTILWTTSLDNAQDNPATGEHLAIAADGSIIVAGQTVNTVGPLPAAIDTNNGNAFVAAYDADGTLRWGTILGGHGGSQAEGVVVAPDGSIYAAVHTMSTDGNLPTQQPDSIVLAHLSTTGSLLSATSIGSTGTFNCADLAMSPDGSLLLAGDTSASTGTITTRHPGNSDAVVVKLTTAGAVLWSAAVGGSKYDEFTTLAVASDGSIDAVGNTTSADGDAPMVGESSNGTTDVLVAQISASGDLTWAHAYGGSQSEFAFGVATTADDGVVVVGSTESTDGDLPPSSLAGTDNALIMLLTVSGAASLR